MVYHLENRTKYSKEKLYLVIYGLRVENELDILTKTTIETIWLNELNKLESEYKIYKIKRETIQAGGNAKKTKAKVLKINKK